MTEESIFTAALVITNAVERAAFLDRVCADNGDLRRRIEELLAAHAASNPLDRPPLDLGRTGAHVPGSDEDAATATVGDRVGPYKLQEKIGEGGMGEVWVADQTEPIKRRVALKLIKPGMDSRSVLARFEAERQALALMDHPNIAKVLDAGTTPDGRPFFVMELVKGTPITEFCDTRKLTPRQRLELFVSVCQAIQHAHLKGIIHRDIKPSNVLVELHDDRPVVKVIDFGVAKAVGQQLTEKTIYTGFGALVGTPAYMAPEQATFNALDIDTRADVYALGVLLYELLAGSPPIEMERLKRAALEEVLRIVRDEEPQRPSQRLSTSQTKASIAATRQSDPEKLSALMKGELDWIVMKALEKDRTRRYETANGFAADVQRYLNGEPVQAVPPSLGYRLWKAYRRNKAAVRVVGLVFLMLIVGILAVGWQAYRAETEAKRALHEEQKAKAALQLAQDNQRKAEVTLCRSFLRPIGFTSDKNRLDPAELQAFRDIAATSDDLRLLTLREALADAETALRVARRTERFVQATVGSSPVRRQAALEIVTPIQNDVMADPRARLLATWVAIELHSPDWGGFTEGLNYLVHRKVSIWGIDWHNYLTPTLVARLDPPHAATLADILLTQYRGDRVVHSIHLAEPALLLIFPKLDDDGATRVFESLVSERDKVFTLKRKTAAELVQLSVARFRADRVDPLIRRVRAAVKPSGVQSSDRTVGLACITESLSHRVGGCPMPSVTQFLRRRTSRPPRSARSSDRRASREGGCRPTALLRGAHRRRNRRCARRLAQHCRSSLGVRPRLAQTSDPKLTVRSTEKVPPDAVLAANLIGHKASLVLHRTTAGNIVAEVDVG